MLLKFHNRPLKFSTFNYENEQIKFKISLNVNRNKETLITPIHKTTCETLLKLCNPKDRLHFRLIYKMSTRENFKISNLNNPINNSQLVLRGVNPSRRRNNNVYWK